jgi:IMP dehydrogenase/GMP reductase
VRHPVGQPAPLRIAVPLVSAIMAAVSSPRLAIALAQTGGLAFIHQGQPPAEQADMVRAVKRHKAGRRPGRAAGLDRAAPGPRVAQAVPQRVHFDTDKQFMVGAGINTRDYPERVPALVEAGADLLCIDSSDGYSTYQRQILDHIRDRCGEGVRVGAGNVVDARGFQYLADAGADFVKVGIGGGSICITRDQKGIGRGQA